MRYVPHIYQEHAIQHIIDNPACGLFLGMGLGKTSSTLAAIDQLMYDYGTVKPGRVLVIAPLKVSQTVWTGEVEKWDEFQHLTISRILGTKKARLAAMTKKAHIYVINRENVDWLVKHWGRNWPYQMVVIDELSSFKAHDSVRFRQLRKVRPLSMRVVGLTGTPSPNGLPDLWSQLYLLDRGERLGTTVGSFREKYLRPISTDGGYVVYKWGLKPGAEEAIYERIGDICISMAAEDWLELPGVIPVKAPVELSAEASLTLKRMEKELVMELEGDTLVAETAASLQGKLTQMASGAVYATPEPGEKRRWIHIHDDKLDALEEILEALAGTGETAMVAYWYQHMLERLRGRFPQARELKTPQDEADWNAGKIPVLLVHPAAAGHGLNLQAGGHILIWAELPQWNLELYQQLNKRLDRQGQTEVVRIIHLLAKGTIDEDQMTALENKDVSQERLMQAVKARLDI